MMRLELIALVVRDDDAAIYSKAYASGTRGTKTYELRGKQQRGDPCDSVRSRKHVSRLLHLEGVSGGAAPMFTGVCTGAEPEGGSCSRRGRVCARVTSQ